MIEFDINLGSVGYPVLVGEGVFDSLESRLENLQPVGSIVILIDEQVAQINAVMMEELRHNSRIFVYVLPGGKNNKSFFSALKIFEFLDVNNISRDSAIVAIGGGVVGDMAGFVASCWYRGISLIHVPTTLLSAVDSCVGGKTAVNFRSTVNAVGTYHHPKAILIDLNVLKTLPRRELSSGFGEIVKYACIGADQIGALLESGSVQHLENLEKLIVLSLQEKEKYVRGDIGEKANRLFLNFGHTIGHALEFSTVYDGEETLRHGEGVGLGMVAILKISERLGYLGADAVNDLRKTLEKYGLPTYFDSKDLGISRQSLIERVIDLCFKDKKRLKDDLRLILVNNESKPFVYPTSDRELLKAGVSEVVK